MIARGGRPGRPRARRERGLSLVELMISMVLGLIVVAAVFNVFTGTTRSARFSTGLETLQENGRHGTTVLQNAFRLAGYSATTPLSPLDIANGGPDSVIVRTQAIVDCAGGSTAGTAGIATNVYRFDAARQLITCADPATPAADAIELVDNVDAFGVLYGLDENGDGAPERFVPWNATLAPASVAALRFAVLVNSGAPIRARARAQRYALLDRVIEPPIPDRIVRHVFQSTAQLRNRP